MRPSGACAVMLLLLGLFIAGKLAGHAAKRFSWAVSPIRIVVCLSCTVCSSTFAEVSVTAAQS